MRLWIMWDSDGIDFRFTTEFARRFGWPNPDQEWEDWSEYKRHGWTTEQFLEALHLFAAEGGFAADATYDDFVPAWKRIDALDAVHVVITDKPTEEAVEHNHARLVDLGCTPHLILKSRDKTDILNFTRPNDIVFGIDDNVGHVESMLDKGIRAYVRDMPWNDHATHLPRVADLHEFASIVENTYKEERSR